MNALTLEDDVPPAQLDRFGNRYAQGLPYARGRLLTSTADDFTKVKRAWRAIERRGVDNVFLFTGLEQHLPLTAEELPLASDELAAALYFDKLERLALGHLGGTAPVHDISVFNRLTAATLATLLELVRPGDVVLGVSASYSHPSVVRAAAYAGATFVDTVGAAAFEAELSRRPNVRLVVLTRLAVTYEIMSWEEIQRVIAAAHERGALVYCDDAGGARVGPAVFGQPKMLDLGVDIGATGLDKYGTSGPRLGLLGGKADLVARVRARAHELGVEARPFLYPAVCRTLEQYSPERVRALVQCTKTLADALRPMFKNYLHETPVTAQLLGDDVLEIAMLRAGIREAPIVPYEATAALCMLLLEDYGIFTVHFLALPPGTSALLLKFIPAETLKRFGGSEKFALAVDASLTKLATLLRTPEQLSRLLMTT
jgi:L-seryl-tRNA(Ser) seleniumtransferase